MSKTLLVTGASSELGVELIKGAAKDYSEIIAHYHSSKNTVLNLKKEIACADIIPLQADFADLGSTKQFVQNILDMGKVPDAIVHLSSLPIGLFSKFEKTKWEDFEQELNVSFRSAVIILQKLMPLMAKRKKGKVVIMLSYNVTNTPQIRNASVYSTAKYALYGLMRSLAAEYAGKGVWVNGVSPSVIDTKFTANNMPDVVLEQAARESPIKRNLSTVDVIKPIRFLLSDDSDLITGQNIGITAGN